MLKNHSARHAKLEIAAKQQDVGRVGGGQVWPEGRVSLETGIEKPTAPPHHDTDRRRGARPQQHDVQPSLEQRNRIGRNHKPGSGRRDCKAGEHRDKRDEEGA